VLVFARAKPVLWFT